MFARVQWIFGIGPLLIMYGVITLELLAFDKRLAGTKPESDKSDSADMDTKVTVAVQNSDGNLVRTFKAPVTQGINRVIWDLNSDGAKPVVDPANSTPQEDPGILPAGPEVLPGQYRFTLSYNNATAEGKANVLVDPRSTVSDSDRMAGYKLSRRLVTLQETANQAISRLLAAASDIDAVIALANKALAENGASNEADLKSLVEDGQTLRKKVESQEARFRVPSKTKGRIYSGDKVTSLIGEAYGYFGNAFSPWSQAVHCYLDRGEKALAEGIKSVNTLFENDISQFRNRAQQLGVVLLGNQEPLVVP